MSKKSTKALASATLMSLVLTTALSAGPVKAAAGKVTRIGEIDRYATAAKVATTSWTTSDDVVLVSGDGYADAVSASALAKKLNAPILLTTAGSLNSDTKNALTTLKAKNVYVVGGEASVSSSVRDELKKTYTLTELGGANRYETNAKVAQKLVDLGVKADEVIMVGGEGFSDALSVAPVAAAKGQILLLGMNNSSYMQPVLDFVSKNKSKVTVVGTKNVISDSILSTINGTRVDGGSDRFDTNLKVLASFKDALKMDKLYVASAQENSRDDGYADALVASALAGKTSAPLVLVDKDGSTATTNAIKYIKDNADKTKTDLNVIGGTGVVSTNVEDQINKAVNDGSPSTPASVESIEAVGLNEIKIVFGSDVDSDSAESVDNYKVDGAQLNSKTAVASLQDDNRTLLITLADAKDQYKDYAVSVKKGVITADKSTTVPALDKTITFSDVKAPTLKSVKAQGRNKLTVEFTAPVDMRTISTLASKFRINDQNITSFGLNTQTSPALSEIKDSITNSANNTWSRKVEFYFDSNLPTGNNTLKVLGGDKTGALVDAGGFTFIESTMDFNVDSKDGKITDKDVTIKADADGTLWVKYGRPMDKKTALDASNYVLLNKGTSPISGATLKLKENDNTVKITGVSSKIDTGSNVLYINKNTRDAFGNEVDDDTRVNFTKEKDETKPTVLTSDMVDSETIRLKFSKDIDATYATQISNYTLKDSSGLDITAHIKEIKPSTSVKTDSGAWDNCDAWDIKMYKNPAEKDSTSSDQTTDWRLTGSKYSLTVKNLADTTSNRNAMAEWNTTLNGNDDVAPKVTAVYAKSATDSDSDAYRKVVVYFSEAMNTSTLTKENFKYKNKSGDSKDLPSSVEITTSNDNKGVTIKFPSNYGMNDSGKDDDNDVIGIIAQNVKDEAGNIIDSFHNGSETGIVAATGTIKLKDSSYRMVYDGDDILVKVQYDGAIDTNTTKVTDFKVAGETPTSISMTGSDLILRFGKNENAESITSFSQIPGYKFNPTTSGDKVKKVDVLKYYAPGSAKYEVVADKTQTRDIAGNTLAKETVAGVYDNSVAPKTTSDYWYATTAQTVNGTKEAAVVLSYDTNLFEGSGVTPDDFSFTVAGKTLKADAVKYVNNNLVFVFKQNADVSATDLDKFASDANVDVSLAHTGITVKSQRDGDGNYALYVPSNDDKVKTRTIKVNSTVDLSKILVGQSDPTPSTDVKATIEQAGTAIVGKTVVVASLPSTVDASKYDVVVNGTTLTYNATSGKFTATLDGTFTVADLQAKTTASLKTVVAVPTATVEQAGTAIVGKTVVVASLPSTVDATKYNVLISGTALTYNATSGKFTATLDGTFTVAQLQTAITVSAK